MKRCKRCLEKVSDNKWNYGKDMCRPCYNQLRYRRIKRKLEKELFE